MVTAIDNLGSFIFDRISHAVVVGVKDSHNCAGQFQCQHPGYPVHVREIQLTCRYQVDKDVAGFDAFSHEQVPQITLMDLLMIKGHGIFAEIIPDAAQDFTVILVHDAAAVYGDDIVKAAASVHAQRQRTILVFISKGEFHLISVSFLLGACLDSFKGVIRNHVVQQCFYLGGFQL